VRALAAPGRERQLSAAAEQAAAAPAATAAAVVDCDVHCAPAAMAQLEPYLDDYWRDYVDGSGIRINGLPVAYPPGAATTARPDARPAGGASPVPSTYEELLDRYLAQAPVEHAILNCLTLFEAHRHPYYVAALAGAINDWLREEWLERDDRLRASMVVPPTDADDAIAEIERVGSDPRFVQVLLPVRADAPWGNKRFHRLFEVAAAHGLVIGLHAWGRPVSAPTPNGLTFTYLEDYVSNQLIAQSHVLSLVSEGVFERVPELRVSISECGFAWLPPLLWRFDKDWKGLWREVPWVKKEPSLYVRERIRATTAPAHLPPDPAQVAELVDMVGSDWLLYASDYPHDHGGSGDLLFAVLDADRAAAVRRGNAHAFYAL
jgi:predicted TIM-barrel fold metal-dependent hydrolase